MKLTEMAILVGKALLAALATYTVVLVAAFAIITLLIHLP